LLDISASDSDLVPLGVGTETAFIDLLIVPLADSSSGKYSAGDSERQMDDLDMAISLVSPRAKLNLET
jgi:hypothetical protein